MVRGSSEIKEYFENVSFGDHICSIYRDKEQQFSVVVPFLKAGLNNNQKCVYITNKNSKENLLVELEKRGIAVNKYLQSNQLLILTNEETYLTNGVFDPDMTIELWKRAEKTAIDEGFSGVRATGEASDICSDKHAGSKLMSYEANINGIFPHIKVIALCQYNEDKLTQDVLIESIHTHPNLIIYGELCENMYFSPATHIHLEHRLPSDAYIMIRDSIVNGD